jgi:ferredoxin-like protein FixX
MTIAPQGTAESYDKVDRHSQQADEDDSRQEHKNECQNTCYHNCYSYISGANIKRIFEKCKRLSIFLT